MTGHLRAHCLGRTIAELGLITEDAREAFRTLLTSSGSAPHRRRAGSAPAPASSASAIGSGRKLMPLKGEAHLVATIIDATELKRAEASLRQSEHAPAPRARRRPHGHLRLGS